MILYAYKLMHIATDMNIICIVITIVSCTVPGAVLSVRRAEFWDGEEKSPRIDNKQGYDMHNKNGIWGLRSLRLPG
jgi:hypothetical protein